MKAINVQIVATLAGQLEIVEALHKAAGEPRYGRKPDDVFKLQLLKPASGTGYEETPHDFIVRHEMPILRESAFALVVAERERIKKLMRGYGVQFPDDDPLPPASGSGLQPLDRA